ncbi:transcriptional regulator with XRE-family HTH domain [Micromonospora sp. A200]|uniref:helix-turn-helix domain-containing protein n=1 Tax=Micromonospora sp. A200 TaxID=2940568 RepID=UPI0024750608|nr:helix-turn-helix transcriptional regulator [Micromonospora sp. A200]MDH6460893.1 transcriptional regulator with XRE-family HTH domain [Micromonospora sp. A200]
MTHTDTSSAEQRFGAQVREAREVRGWSQEALARHLRESAGIELHQTAVARLERGERTIRFNEVAALAKLLGLDLQAYSAELPTLTDDEYEHAKESLERTRAQEEQATRDLLRVQDQLTAEMRDLTQERRTLVEQRQALEAMIRAYEERRDG